MKKKKDTCTATKIGNYILLALLCFVSTHLYANEKENHPVLVITSYNPEVGQMAQNISLFLEEYNKLKIDTRVIIENMNCKSLPEAYLWTKRMSNILAKHKGKHLPSLIVIFGQEAWAAYLSQEQNDRQNIPVICGMVSENAVILPTDSASMSYWNPKSTHIQSYIDKGHVIGGLVYKYDVARNLKLILDFYPNTKHIAFISDNTYGGASIQSLVKEEIQNFPQLDLILLDGRKSNIYSIIDQIKNLPKESVILLGTWRVDVNDGYYMRNATYSMMSANPSVPAFSISSIGLGHWAIGGYMPKYRPIGGEIATQVGAALNDTTDQHTSIQTVNNEYTFDQKKLDELGFSAHILPMNSIIINNNINVLDKYKNELIFFSFVVLLLFIITLLLYYFRMKKLKDVVESVERDKTIILNNIRSSIKFVNPDYSIKWSNQISYPCNPEHGPEHCCLIPNRQEPHCSFCPIVKAIQTGVAETCNYKSSDGQYIFVLANPIYDKRNKLMGLIVKKEDISESKKVENELREAKERAEESDRLKSAFLANMSHEIRTPLNAIVGFSTLLSDADNDEDRNNYISIIETNNELLLQLINDILDLAKIEAGTIEFTYTDVDINKLLSEIEQTFRHKANENVSLSFSEKEATCVIHTEKNRITQVITNFLTNALKFTSSGSIQFGYRIQTDTNKIYFFVTDTGWGISEIKLKSIFERFVKLNSFVQGTGLGLSICQMIIQELEGEIGVLSKEGEGSTFWFTIPYQPTDAPQ